MLATPLQNILPLLRGFLGIAYDLQMLNSVARFALILVLHNVQRALNSVAESFNTYNSALSISL